MKNGIKILIAAVCLGLTASVYSAPSQTQFFGCYTRGADTIADQLGMPWSFCLNSVTVELEAFKAVVSVEGTNLRTRFELRDIPEHNGSYFMQVPLFSNGSNAVICDDATEASIILSFRMDKKGVIDQGSFALSASSGETTDSCHSQMRETAIPLLKQAS